MRDLTATSVTEAVLEQMSGAPDPRLKQVMASLVRHLHDFAREVSLTPEEWLTAIGFLTKVGQTCTPARQEFVLLSDVLGLSALVNLLHDKIAAEMNGVSLHSCGMVSFLAPGLLRFARNDGERMAEISPRHCEFGTGLRPTRMDETCACFRGSWIAALRSQ